MALLSKLQNDLLATENQLVAHYYDKINADKIKVDKLAALVSSPTNYIIQGLSYKANVMLTAYSSTQNPDIFLGTFNNQVKRNGSGGFEELISNTETPPLQNAQKVNVTNGLANVELSGNAIGEKHYTGVVRIKDPNGNGCKFFPFEGSYQVAPKTVVVSPTMMNVLYVGLENPVSISVPGVAQRDVLATVAGNGVLERVSDGNFVMRLTTPGKTKVQVTAKVCDKTLAVGEQEFRIKRVPNPVLKIDGIYPSGKITLAQLKSSSKLRALAVNFDFSVNYKVIGYTFVYRAKNATIDNSFVSGESFSQSMLRLIQTKIRKGETIWIDDVTVECPGAERRKYSGLSYSIL